MEARREHLKKDCPICCEAYDMDKCFAVSCFACGYTACSTCVKHYITDTAFEASCLNADCRKVRARACEEKREERNDVYALLHA